MHFRYTERVPAPELTPWIASYWEFTVGEGAPPTHHVPPDGCTSLLVPVGGPHGGMLLYSGPWIAPLAVPVTAGSRFVGVRLRPGATEAVTGMSPSRLFNATIPAAMFGGATGVRLQRRIVEQVAATRTLQEAAPALDALWRDERQHFGATDVLVSAVVDALVASHGETRIAAIADTHACSDRTLRRRFRNATALSPKQFARVRRLLGAAWHAVDGVEQWGRIAAEAGYADHAHLHHDVKEIMGIRPEELAEHLRGTRHDQVSRRIPDGTRSHTVERVP